MYRKQPDEESKIIAAAVQFSDFFCNIQRIGNSGSVKVALIQKDTKDIVNLSANKRKDIIEEVKQEVSRAKSFFEIK